MTDDGPLRKGDTVVGRVESLAFGGDGVVRTGGFVYFVPLTAPGDEIEAEVTDARPRYGRARLIKRIADSSDRVEPFCPLYGRCGGCQLQHIDIPMQHTAKRTFVEDAFARIGGIDVAIAPDIGYTERDRGYRYRMRFTTSPDGSPGLVSVDGQTIISVEHCPVFCESGNELLTFFATCREEFRDIGVRGIEIRVSPVTQERSVLIITPSGQGTKRLATMISSAFDDTGIAVSLSKTPRPGAGFRIIEGDPTLVCVFVGRSFEASPLSFVQPNPLAAEHAYLSVIAVGGSERGTTILDGHCGIGVTSVLLADTADNVFGIEENPHAIQDAVVNAAVNETTNVYFSTGRVEQIVSEVEHDTLVLNPPRTGVAGSLFNHPIHAERIIYLSCDPPTLARDARRFASLGFVPRQTTVFDFYPHTYHTETLCVFRRE